MSCVNRSSKEFKFLAERNNLSINALELITHKYWLENKTEDYFPSNVYIQAQLGKIPYEEPSKPVRDLWEMKYKEPQTFKTLEALEDARKEALRYFPEEAVTYHMDFKDNFVMVVRKPIAKMSLSVSDLTGKSSHDEQELADYDLITGNIIQELNNNRNFAAAENLKRQVKNTQLENTIDAIDKVAKSGKWNENTLQQLNNLTNNIKDGKVTFKRFPGRVHEAYRKMAGGVAAGAWLLFARDGRTMEEKSRTLTPKERYAREEADKPGQEKALVAWAKAAGVWYEDASIPVKGMEHKKNLDGGEAMIYAKDAHTYRKLISNDYFITPQLMLDRIVIHNALSPAKLTLQGFTQNNEGNLLFIVDQPIVEGITPTKDEINDLASLLKLEKHPRISGNTFISKDGTLYVSDLHDENVIKNANGDSIIIDTEARLNTPDLGKEGTYIPDNSLEYTAESSEFDSLQMSISSPQTFTFKDGTTVKAPFKPNYQQVDALNAMDEFIKSDKTSMTLSGYAGTGKTSLMEMLAQKMDKQHKPIMFCASTNKAAAVLKERVSKSGFDAFTLNKVFGIAVEVDPNQSYNAKNLVNKLKDVDILAGTTIIIDEASMINEENYDILNSIAQRNGLKIIYVGDAAQLAPVNETKISKVFRDQNHEVRTLSIVERTGDNAILKEATALRDGEALSGESSFNSKGQGVAYIKNTNVKERDAIIKRFIPELRSNPNYFRILAYTNAAVAAYNTQVRQLLGYNDSVPRVGEPITGYANWGYIWDRNGGKYRFINSEAYKVTKVESPRNARITLPEGTTVTMQAIPITLENSLGERDTFNFMDIKGNQENRAAATQLAQLKSKLWSKARKSTGETKSKILQQINEIDKFLFVNDNITEGKRTLQAKVFDFGYAMTVHKSQGSTFTHVLMDDVDISKAKIENVDKNMSWPTFNEESLEDPDLIKKGTPDNPFGLEGWSDDGAPVPEMPIQEVPRKKNPNIANVRQQLKYVAVSRATDTVTIISDNVKKEDSPLNHINKAQVSEASPSENKPATSSKPVEQMSSKEVWNYLSAMQPLAKRSQVEYTPQGQARQTYTIEDGHIYNSKRTEVYPGKTVHKNMILANHAVKEGLAVVVEHPTSGEKYVVDNNQQITSVRTGKIMQWGEENGDRRRILTQAEKKFRDRIIATKERGGTLNEQLLDYLKLIGIDVHNETEMAKYLKEHGYNSLQEAVRRVMYNFNLTSSEKKAIRRYIESLSKETDTSKGLYYVDKKKGFVYWFNTSLVQYDDNRALNRDGFEIINKYDIRNLNKQDQNNIDDGLKQPKQSISRIIAQFGLSQRVNDDNIIVVDYREGEDISDSLDKQSSASNRGASNQGSGKDKGEEFFQTPEGEIKGFATPEGSLYFDRNVMSPEHPIHEYTHLWDRVVAKNNPELWNRGITLMKQISLWKEIENDENYGRKWKDMKGMTPQKLESLIASEVHSRLAGVNGEQLLDRLSKEKGQKGIIGRLKQWLLDFWKDLKGTFSNWSQEDLDKLTLQDFTMMTIRDFADGFNPNTFSASSTSGATNIITQQPTPQQASVTEAPPSGLKVSLPGYEHFTEATEDTPVDAEWKIPYLQELDSQLNANENPDIILEQMHAILEATSEEEWLNKSNPKAKEQVAKTLDEYDKLITQLNNLLDSNLITASEVRHTAELVVNAISDNISQLQKEKGLAEQQFPTLNSKLDFQTASRKDIIKTVGIERLIYRAKLLFDPKNNEYEDRTTLRQAKLIMENWDAIMTLASDIFAMNEGMGITKDFENGNWKSTEGQKIDFDNFNDYKNDPDAMAEETKDEQEHWQIEQRTIDILNSMSAMVRLALHECYQVDRDGNTIKSKWGIPERVNSRKAVNSILRWTQGSLSLEDMVSKLSAKQNQNPWLSQLITRLTDKSGNDTDFQSQFYGVFSKHFQLYSVVLLEDGKYHSIAVNSHPALTEAMQTITTQFRVGEHPLFTSKGINKTLLGNENTTGTNAPFNLHKALAELQLLDSKIQHGEDLTAETVGEAAKNVTAVCRTLGYTVTEELVADIINENSIADFAKYLGFMVNSLDKAAQANKSDYDPFAYNKENSIGGTLRNFLTPITDVLEDTATNAFYDSGKMYQSYVTPSFMTKLLQKFRLEGQAFEDFLEGEYGNSEWFKFKGRNGAWRNEWLRILATNEDARKVFDHKVELNFNKHNYMRNMSDAEYTLSLFAEYFVESSDDKQSLVPAWFRIPMQSNKPSSEFIKFYSYRGATYKEDIVHGLHSMFLQELSRIQTVSMRNKSKDDPSFIKNFDKNGKQFNFLPFLNSYLDNSTTAKKGRNLLETEAENNELAFLLQKRIDTTKKLTPTEESRLDELVDRAIYNHMETRAQDILAKWEQEGILEAAKQVEGVGTEDADVRRAIENYLWNDCFAAKNILQLTVGDIAFYKDAEDLQKRLAQLHAPGIRSNVAATDYGNPEKGIPAQRVSDGYYRTFILQDFDTFKSNIIANIAEVFDRKIAAAPENQKVQLRALKESLVGKDGKYTKINVTDAQGYSSPSSYRKKAFMFGKWSHKAEDIYQKLLSGDYTYTDLEVAFQPLKPFVYTHLEKHIGDGTPIETMNVPFQAKNSEYLLIMADAIMQSEVRKSGELSRPNLLRAVYRVMEDSERLNPTKGIDTVQFESAIKSGLQGKMNIHQFAEKQGGEEAAYTFMMSQIYQNYDPKKPVEEQGVLQYNTDTFVHEAPYEDYCLQQEVPEHFKGHQQAHGSQIRMITPSDLDLYKDPNGNPNDENNINYYEWTEPDGTKRKVRADEFKREYEETIAANIEESIENLSKELHLDSSDKKERNIALSKILLREILSSPRYGIDLAQACAVDKATGEFRIPKGDPIQAKRIEQLINSIIKNRVNKQKIAGGPIVQVTNFGTSKQLHIRFKDKDSGELLMTEEEYTKRGWAEHVPYKEYIKHRQGGIAYFEVFIPIWANEIFEKFANEDGTIDVKAIEAVDPDLLKMISYRIPTEDKYSCAPMKVVGFMPREAGDAIMLPYELTEIDDSDFDVDKRYVMRKDIQIVENKPAIEKLLIQRVSESYARAHDGKVNKRFITEQIKMYMDNPDRMKTADKLMEAIHKEKQVIMKLYKDKVWKTIKPTSGKLYRDNKIVDMTWAVLTNEETADKILNPGGFDNFKRAGYMAAAYRLHSGEYTWQQLQAMSIDELSDLCYVDKDLTWADTQIQFYKQNAAAASLIGVFAVNKVAHATLEGDDIFLAVDEICGEEPFAIAGTQFSGRMQVDPKYDSGGNLIGKTLGSGVSASADAAKTPVLNLLNINMTTVGTFTSLLRLGMPHEDACMFIGQDVIARVLDEFNHQNLTGYASLNSVIDKEIKRLKEAHNISDDADINKEPLSKEELVRGLTPEEHEVIDYKVLIAFQKAKAIAENMRKISFATRFNSISSAVGPLIIDNLIMEHKMEQFMDENADTHFYTHDDIPVDITDVFADHPVLKQFAETVKIARQMTADMPAGSTGFRNLLAKLPDDIKEKIYNDKKLFSNLSDFYQSYLAIASGLINPANLKNYIDGFPKWFMKQDFKEKYPDNALIQAIQMTVSKKTGRAFLSIKLTGEDETVKETYRNAWIDLHKSNPELSQQLFEYCFFRAGIGFSPKTFMAVVPTYVKERLQKKLSNGETATYLDTYRRFPSVTKELVIDQFIANNWEDNKLIPKKGGKNSHFTIKGDHLYATVQEDIDDLEGLTYIKTSGKGVTYLWKKVSDDKAGVHYVKMKPLGNNGEYVEMSLSEISTPLTTTTQTSENNDASEIKTTSQTEIDATEEKAEPVTTENKRAKAIAALAKDFMTYNETSFGRKVSDSKAAKQAEDMVDHPERFGGLMQNILKSKGIEMSKDEAIKKLKELDLC